jgi:hypothetical protein
VAGACVERVRIAMCNIGWRSITQLRQVTSFIHQLARHGERTPKVTYATTPTVILSTSSRKKIIRIARSSVASSLGFSISTRLGGAVVDS